MGLKLSRAWDKTKSTVKSVAKSIKNTAKKIAYSTKIGKKVWDFGARAVDKVKEGVGKITEKLGPAGVMALSFVLGPALGPMLSSMWSGFGAGALGMSQTATGIAGALGKAGTAIFNGANFAGSTLGAMGDAITKGIGELGSGLTKKSLGRAGDAFASNMKSAFTGEAGKAGMSNMASKATQDAARAAFEDRVMGVTADQIDLGSKGLADGTGDLFTPTPDEFGDLGGLDKEAGNLINTKETPMVDLSDPKLTQKAMGLEDPSLIQPPTEESTMFQQKPESGFVDKALDVGSSVLGSVLDGYAAGDTSAFDSSLASRKFHEVSDASKANAITATGESNLFQRLVAQSRGSFA